MSLHVALDIEPPDDLPPLPDPRPPGDGHILALAKIGAIALATARINGATGDSGLLHLSRLSAQELSGEDVARFERLVASAELGLLDVAIANRADGSSYPKGTTGR